MAALFAGMVCDNDVSNAKEHKRQREAYKHENAKSY
jgi:hypothetical protein